MTNLIVALKDEIRRIARKEIRAQVSSTKRAAAQHRREIAKLKRQLQQQARQLHSLQANGQKPGGQRPGAESQPSDDSLAGARFSARSVKAQRKRLRLSAEEYGQLVGVSGQTIYSWEQGASRPRRSQMVGLVAARSLGRREAGARLESLHNQNSPGNAKGRRLVRKPR